MVALNTPSYLHKLVNNRGKIRQHNCYSNRSNRDVGLVVLHPHPESEKQRLGTIKYEATSKAWTMQPEQLDGKHGGVRHLEPQTPPCFRNSVGKLSIWHKFTAGERMEACHFHHSREGQNLRKILIILIIL